MTDILLFIFGCISGYGLISIIFATKKGMGFILRKYTHDTNSDIKGTPLNMIGARRGFGSASSRKIIRKRRGFGAENNND